MDDYEGFKKKVFTLTSIDLDSYKERQMRRRIDTLIKRHCMSSYEEFVAAIKADKNLFEEFVNYLTINVSEFYRNPEQWKLLDEEIIPVLVKNTVLILKYGVLPVLQVMSHILLLWHFQNTYRLIKLKL